MKKMICLLTALVLCACLAVPAFATEDGFVPSIGYQDGPAVKEAIMNGEDVDSCVVVTTIKGAREQATEIKQSERDLLLSVNEKLNNGDMKLPLDGDYVIRELLDISFEYDDCRDDETHGSKDVQLKQPGVTLKVTLDMDMNLSDSEKLSVLVYVDDARKTVEAATVHSNGDVTYVDGAWKTVEAVTVHSNGDVTIVFEDICPVAFCVERKAAPGPSSPQTGDMNGEKLVLWGALMVVSAAAMAAVVINRRKFVR